MKKHVTKTKINFLTGLFLFSTTLSFGQILDNCVYGTVFCDANGNGILDNNEVGVPNASLNLLTGGQTMTHQTDQLGVYEIPYSALAGQNSTLELNATWMSQYGYTSINPDSTFMDIQCVQGGFLLNIAVNCESSLVDNCVYGTLFCDENGNGIMDNNEIGIANATVNVISGGQTTSLQTNQNGMYYITYIGPESGSATLELDATWMSLNGYSSPNSDTSFVSNECIQNGTSTNLALICNPSLSIKTLTTIKTTVYPNPAQDKLNISSNGTISEVRLYDLTGKKVASKTGSNITSVNLMDLMSGVYLMEITVNGQTTTQRVVKR